MTAACILLVCFGVQGLLPLAATPLAAAARRDASTTVVVRGSGPTVVLLSGLLGGTARLLPLAERLVEQGFRVVAIDPYRLSASSPDVSFDGMARTVATALQREAASPAIVVAHAHAAGIALRLAANAPGAVTHLVLLDAGVIARTRSPGIDRAMRVASLVARVPGGAGVIRSRLAAGMRANSGDPRWVDAVSRAYTEPLIAELPAVARLAARLVAAVEPEPLERVVDRVRIEVTAILGAAPHQTGATEQELAWLARLPAARIVHAAGIGHFVHEEAPEAVVAEVLAMHARRLTARR